VEQERDQPPARRSRAARLLSRIYDSEQTVAAAARISSVASVCGAKIDTLAVRAEAGG
jgi:hypothetical protein